MSNHLSSSTFLSFFSCFKISTTKGCPKASSTATNAVVRYQPKVSQKYEKEKCFIIPVKSESAFIIPIHFQNHTHKHKIKDK